MTLEDFHELLALSAQVCTIIRSIVTIGTKSGTRFRFLDLPFEIHRLIYKELFSETRVVIVSDLANPFPHVKATLESYHPAIIKSVTSPSK